MMERNCLPDMLAGDELIERLTVKPVYDENIRNQPMNVRLIELASLYCHASNYSSHLRHPYRRLNSASPSYCLS